MALARDARNGIGLLVIGTLLILAASCTGAQAPAATGAPAASAAGSAAAATSTPQPTYSVRLAAAGDALQWTAFYVAETGGFYKQENVNVQMIQAEAAQSLQAVLTGSADMATGSIHVTQAAAAGRDVKAFGAILGQFGASFILSNRLISQAGLAPGTSTVGDVVKAVKGKTIGISSAGSAIDVMIRGLLREYGLDPNKDVTLVPLGASGTGFVAALQRGDLDGFVYTAPWPEVAETQNLGKVIINMYAGEYPALDGIYFNTLYASKAFGSTNNAAAMAFSRAIEKSLRFIAARPDDAAKMVRTHFKDLSDAAYGLAWSHVLPALPKTLAMNDRGFQLNIKLAQALDPKAKVNVKVEDIYSNVIPLAVAKQLDDSGWKP